MVIPGHALACNGMPRHALACQGVPWHARAFFGMPGHATACHCMPGHGMQGNLAMPGHALACHGLPSNALACHGRPKGISMDMLWACTTIICVISASASREQNKNCHRPLLKLPLDVAVSAAHSASSNKCSCLVKYKSCSRRVQNPPGPSRPPASKQAEIGPIKKSRNRVHHRVGDVSRPRRDPKSHCGSF